MQTSDNQLKRQQQILKGLNFYNGEVDGIWGPASIAAMKKFEAHPSFLPGVPNNGMPLKDRQIYPAGIVREPTGLLHHPVLDAKPAAKSAPAQDPQAKDKGGTS